MNSIRPEDLSEGGASGLLAERRGWTAEALDLPPGPLPRLFAHWDGLRAGRDWPARSEIDAITMAPFLRHVFLIEALPDGDWLYRVAGSHIIEGLGAEVSRRRLSECGTLLDVPRIRRELVGFLADPVPQFVRRRSAWGLRDWTMFDRLFLPLGPADRPTHVLGGMQFQRD